jgi:hypothetical protein
VLGLFRRGRALNLGQILDIRRQPLLLQGPHAVADLVRIPRGGQDLLGVFLEDLDPALDVGGVSAWVVADAGLTADRVGGDLDAGLFLSVAHAAEGMSQVPVPSGGVAIPPHAGDRHEMERVASRPQWECLLLALETCIWIHTWLSGNGVEEAHPRTPLTGGFRELVPVAS